MKNAYSRTFAALTAHANKTEGALKDLTKCIVLKNSMSHYFFNEACFTNGINKYGIDWDNILQIDNQKVTMRCIQMVNMLDIGLLSLGDYTHIRVVCAMHLAQKYELNGNAIASLCSGARNPDANLRGLTFDGINRLFKFHHKLSTVRTKMSNSIGASGFLQCIGVTHGEVGKNNRPFALNREHPLFLALLALVDKTSKGQIDAMNEKQRKKDEA